MISNDEIARSLEIMSPFYNKHEMKVLTAFLEKIMAAQEYGEANFEKCTELHNKIEDVKDRINALESKCKSPEPVDVKSLSALDVLIKSGNIPTKKPSAPVACINTTDYAYTVVFNHKGNEWLSVAHIGDGETVATAEGVTEIDAFWNLMLKL